MQSIPNRQLLKTAFITAPLMALMLVTPAYLLIGIEDISFIFAWGMVTLAISLTWILNIVIINKVKKRWALSWVRILLCASIMIGISFIGTTIIGKERIKVSMNKVNVIRVINILAVNGIIFILIDLTMTKENKNKMALENANLKLVNLEAEFKLLKDQINPHFLFNALSTAKALIKQKPELAEDYIVRLSDFLRASINNDKKTVSLKDELALCRDFISLNRIRFGEALQFECDIKTDADSHFVPYFSLLSLLENAVKHNQFTLESPMKIKIAADDKKVIVNNNRQSKFRIDDSPKTGLKNLNERYKFLTGNNIAIDEAEDHFTITMSLIQK
jgi:two-component system, LytTR family, sensor kinase